MTAYVDPLYADLLYTQTETSVVAGAASAESPLGDPRAVGALPSQATCTAESPLVAPAALGAAVILGRLAVASPLGSPASLGQIIITGAIAAPSPLAAPAVVGTVVRYELRGEVRDQGVLVNRRVRAHRRSDGALIAEGDTVAGLFALPAGFAADEYYLVPINLDAAATDFAPPCANRVTSVLAMDSV